MKLSGSPSLLSPGSLQSGEWRKPFNLSISLHIAVAGIAMLATTFFEHQPRLPEIYTVNLFTATEMTQAEPPVPSPAAKQPETQTVRQLEPAAEKPAISMQPSKPETATAAPEIIEPVSLNPVKTKMKIGKTLEEEALEKASLNRTINRIRASAAEREAKERAEEAARNAVSKLADSLKVTTGKTSNKTAAKTAGQSEAATDRQGVTGPKGTGVEPEFYMKQYLSAIYQKIHDHWVLPDLQNWDNALEAVLTIVIKRDGSIEESFFEHKSDNIYFNQFVLKAVKEASPLPPFPGQLDGDTLEVGLRFRPGELGY